jgi:nucleotide-binding universal stress UspA family protein
MNVTVVVGVDYSEASKEALRLAAQEARWRQAPLIAVSAYEPPIGPVGGFPGSAMHTGGEQQATAEAELRATVHEELGDQAMQTELRVSAGLAGRVIVETARHGGSGAGYLGPDAARVSGYHGTPLPGGHPSDVQCPGRRG